MAKMIIDIAPKPAERPRFVADLKRTVTPIKYLDYKNKMIESFNYKYGKDEEIRDILRNAKYGISISILYKFDKKNSNRPYHRQRPDLDNLAKATIDALFESEVNQDFISWEKDVDGRPYKNFKNITDDCNIVMMKLMKINVPAEEVGQEIVIKKMLEEDL